MRPDPRLLLLLLLAAFCLAAAPSEPPGHRRNLAQQQLQKGDLEGGLQTIASLLQEEPEDGFTHGLLAEVLSMGLNLGPETAAVYRHLADSQPERPVLEAFVAHARRQEHRSDRFLGPTSTWFVETMGGLDAALAKAPMEQLYELHLARRSLYSLIKQRDQARFAGLAAHALAPLRLQGRFSAMSDARAAGDLQTVRDGCLAVLKTDPWAAEACSMLWGMAFPDDAAKAQELVNAQSAILARVTELEASHLKDPVTANELLKFYARAKLSEPKAAYMRAVQQANPGFRYVNRSEWWRTGVVVGPSFRAMNIATTHARAIEDPAERLNFLLAHWDAVPPQGDSDYGLTRYLKAVANTALELGDSDRQRAALEVLSSGRPDDPEPALDLARLLAEADPAAAAIQLSIARNASLEAPYEPSTERSRRRRFDDFVQRREDRLSAIAEVLERLEKTPEPGPGVGAEDWLSAPADGGFAAEPWEADIQGLSLLPPEERGARVTPQAAARFAAVMPQIEALGGDPAAALLAAAEARAQDRASRTETDGKEQHPFVGQPAPPFSVTTLDGRSLDNAALTGRVVVVDFWATWCGPCTKEMPLLDALRQRLGDAPVTFLAVSVDAELTPVPPFVERTGYGFDYTHVGEVGMKQEWSVRGIPSLFVLAPDGTVAHHHQGFRGDIGQVLEAEIRGLLPAP